MTFVQLLLWPSAVISRLLYGRWLNPTSLYAVWWSVVLVLYTWRLIEYDPTSPATTVVVGLGALSFVVGSLTVPLVHYGRKGRAYVGMTKVLPSVSPLAIYLLTGFAILSVASSAWDVFRQYGADAYLNLSSIYRGRLTEGLGSGIPYLGAFSLSAVSLVGIALGQGSWRNGYVAPLLVVLIDSITSAGRLMLLWSLLLVGFGFTAGVQVRSRKTSGGFAGWKLLWGIVLSVGLLAGGVLYITSNRSVSQHYGYESRALIPITSTIPYIAHLYHYIAGGPAVLNAYLEQGDADEPEALGSYTFKPVYNVLDRFGITDAEVPHYPPMYYTPVRSNPGTYLKDLLVDFGIMGVVLIPWLMGAISSGVWWRAVYKGSWLALLTLPWLLLIIFWSFSNMATSHGTIAVGILGNLAVAIRGRRARPAVREVAAQGDGERLTLLPKGY